LSEREAIICRTKREYGVITRKKCKVGAEAEAKSKAAARQAAKSSIAEEVVWDGTACRTRAAVVPGIIWV
jgi:hypothetical protein